mgnify:CR=1 FL=1
MYNSFFGGFMGDMLERMEADNKARIKKEFGITRSDNGMEGCERLNIPFKFDSIEICGKYDEGERAPYNYFYCYSNDRQDITLYKTDGTFLFECNKVEYYKQGMFLVGKKKEIVIVGKERADEFGYALYNEGNKLTEPIFRPLNMSGFNEEGFAVVGTGKSFDYGIINMSGEIIFKAGGLHSPYLHGVLCSHNSKWINLLTREVICDGYDSMHKKEFYFVKVDDNCIYQINIR